jgi:hypothetical protein
MAFYSAIQLKWYFIRPNNFAQELLTCAHCIETTHKTELFDQEYPDSWHVRNLGVYTLHLASFRMRCTYDLQVSECILFCGLSWWSCELFQHRNRRGGTRFCARPPRFLLVHTMLCTIGLKMSRMHAVFSRFGGSFLIHAATDFVLRTHFHISSTTTKLFCFVRTTAAPLQGTWLWHSCGWHQLLREYYTTHHKIHSGTTLKIPVYNVY